MKLYCPANIPEGNLNGCEFHIRVFRYQVLIRPKKILPVTCQNYDTII